MPAINNDIQKIFITAIKKASEEQDISLHQISVRAGYNKATLYKLTSGENLGSLDTWQDFFNIVGIKIGFKIEGEPSV